MASAQMTPARTPRMRAPTGFTELQAGVMATRPATMPEAAPSEVACPSRSFSVISQPRQAAAVAATVFTQTTAAVLLAPIAEPALKPNQPNQSRPAPSITSGRLCGRIGSLGQPTRLPITRARARPAAPALMWTAVPPAKSIALSRLATQPPTLSGPAVVASNANTQCATGKYTIVAQITEKMHQVVNLARSAIAPEIRATVMIAKTSWKATKASAGTVSTRCSVPEPIKPFSPKYW